MRSAHRSPSPFGIRLRQFREEAILTQEELAARTGLSLRGISDLERGVRTTPRLETVRMLADGLGLTAEQRTDLLRSRSHRENQPAPHLSWTKGRLPSPTTSFFGRQQEIERVRTALASGAYRLVTLVGSGGVGKTRTAIEAANLLRDEYGENVVFVDLSLVRDPSYVIPALADRLGIPVKGEHELEEMLLVSLQGRRTLLVLDNMEQVIEAADHIAWLLRECPDLHIIVTSRGVLHISAECVIPMEPLDVPLLTDLESLHYVDAIRLFVARVNAIRSPFELTGENAVTIAAIVNRLQGIPLAIELAAARMRLFSLTELLERLSRQLQVLDGGFRDAPDRHRGMRDTIAWSYDLLSLHEQRVFRSLSIYPDGCTLATAVAILREVDDLEARTVEEAIEMLVRSSMVSPYLGQDGSLRYRMLEILREFGIEQLESLDERTALQWAAHERWCFPLIQHAEYVYIQPNAVDGMHRLDEEYRNLREHLAWLIDHGHPVEALEVSGAIASYRRIRGYLGEGRSELEMLLRDPHNQVRTPARINALVGLGTILEQQGDSTVARVLEQCARDARELGESRYLITALSWHAVVLANLGDNEQAEASVQEARSVALMIGDDAQMCGVTLIRAFIAENIGNRDLAFQLMNEALTRAQAREIIWFTAIAKLSLSAQYIARGELDCAESMVLAARDLYAELGDRRDLPAIYLNLAMIARDRGDLLAAHDNLACSLEIARDIGSMGSMAESYFGLAQLSLLQELPHAARSQLLQAFSWWMRCGYDGDAARCLDELVEIALDTDDAGLAAWCNGAIDSLMATSSLSRSKAFISDYEHRLARSRSLLSPTEWQERYERGRSLTLPEMLLESGNASGVPVLTEPYSGDARQEPTNQDRG